jgi:hypothetical protein
MQRDGVVTHDQSRLSDHGRRLKEAEVARSVVGSAWGGPGDCLTDVPIIRTTYHHDGLSETGRELGESRPAFGGPGGPGCEHDEWVFETP